VHKQETALEQELGVDSESRWHRIRFKTENELRAKEGSPLMMAQPIQSHVQRAAASGAGAQQGKIVINCNSERSGNNHKKWEVVGRRREMGGEWGIK